MPIIPNDEQFVGISSSQDLIERGSNQTNSARTIYTYADIKSGLTFEWGDITGTLSNQTDLQNALDAKQETLVSGTNIKTINGTSVLGSGDLAIEWGDITGTLSNQTDLQNALDAKQETLVSATNIKTINGTSILGSGDLPISGGGGGGGGLNSYVVGAWINLGTTAAINSSSLTTVTTTANYIIYYLYLPAQDWTCTEFGIRVFTASTGSARIGVYDDINPTNNDGRPGALLYGSPDLDMTTTGVKTATTSFNFEAGKIYYLAWQSEATPNVRALRIDAIAPIGMNGYNSTVSAFRSSRTYANGFYNPASFSSTWNSSVPMITMEK